MWRTAALLLLALVAPHVAAADTLRVATVNMWSGLDYVGTLRMGAWESAARRDQRLAVLIDELRRHRPHVLLVQEASPIGTIAGRLADALDYDEIHQVTNAGIKLGALGLPSNLKEGLAILAHPDLRIEEAHTWKLSGGFGLHGDLVTLHGAEAVFALVARIRVGDRPMYVVNTHFSAAPELTDELIAEGERLRADGSISTHELATARAELASTARRRMTEAEALAEHLSGLDPRVPVIVGGDFNATLASGELASLDSLGYRTALPERARRRPTWDVTTNANAAYSTRFTDANGQRHAPLGILSALYDRRARAIDHIFLSTHFLARAALDGDLFLDAPRSLDGGDSIYASDHYGVIATLDIDALEPGALVENETTIDGGDAVIDALPIATYDTDAGFGYGAKGYLRNLLGESESFDLTLFNSTEGERWYRAVVSWPDQELRHRKRYTIAFDLELDYDKWIRNSFFGVGNATRFEDRRYYEREPIELVLTASRGVTADIVASLGLRYRTVSNGNYIDSARWTDLVGLGLDGRRSWGTLFASVRYDTRNGTVAPYRGVLLQGEIEHAPGLIDDVEMTRVGVAAHAYLRLWYPTTVLALRIASRGVMGPAVPVHALLSLGGNNTLRGSPQDRYLDRVLIVANAELRFPIAWRFGGVVGYDAGKVWHDLAQIDLRSWPVNPVVGLRFTMETFVVRLDVGLGRETTGLYFNFGHAF